jgi:hypothetical protein
MTVVGFAGKRRIVDIPGDASGFLPILATTTSRRVVIDESQITAEGAPNAPQGVIDYQLPNDGSVNGFVTVFRATQGAEGIQGAATLPIEIGNPVAGFGMHGEIVGQAGQPIIGLPGGTAATTLIKLRSGSATGTSVSIVEYN